MVSARDSAGKGSTFLISVARACLQVQTRDYVSSHVRMQELDDVRALQRQAGCT